MSTTLPEPASPGPRPPAPQHQEASLLRRLLYTNNPWYVISAGLVFWGLRSSFQTDAEPLNVGLLVGCLAVYTALLAATALVLVRVGGGVWEDARMLVLLVLLLFFALSVTLDDAFVNHPELGRWMYIGAAALAGLLIEGLLWGMGVRLRVLWRLPIHALVALMFLYPLALDRAIRLPQSPQMYAALALFPVAAAALLLTLIPAVRRGGEYVRDNGTPWSWPWFPWTPLVVIIGCVALRSYHLCQSLHFVAGFGSVFEPYFLSPLLFAIGWLVLERGLVRKSPTVQWAAMAYPLLAVALAGTRFTDNGVQERMRGLLMEWAGGTPLVLSLAGATAFGALAMLRGAQGAGTLAALSMIGGAFASSTTALLRHLDGPPELWPLGAAAALLFLDALFRRGSARWFLAAVATGLFVSISPPVVELTDRTDLVMLHLVLLAAMVLGVVGKDRLAELFRGGAALMLAGVVIAALIVREPFRPAVPLYVVELYALGMVVAAWVFGRWAQFPPMAAVVVVNLIACAAFILPRHYLALRPEVRGLDAIVAGLTFFVAAAGVSVHKSERLRQIAGRASRRLGRLLDFAPPETSGPAAPPPAVS